MAVIASPPRAGSHPQPPQPEGLYASRVRVYPRAVTGHSAHQMGGADAVPRGSTMSCRGCAGIGVRDGRIRRC